MTTRHFTGQSGKCESFRWFLQGAGNDQIAQFSVHVNNGGIDDPLLVFIGALRSALGSVIVLFISLCAGTLIAQWCVGGMIPVLTSLPVVTMGMIALAIMQVWGLLLFAALLIILYLVLFQEKSLLHMSYLALVLQTLTVIIARWKSIDDQHFDAAQTDRILEVFVAYAVIYLAVAGLRWLMMRNV